MRRDTFEITDRNTNYGMVKYLKKNESPRRQNNFVEVRSDRIQTRSPLVRTDISKIDEMRLNEEEKLSNEKIKPCPLCKKPIFQDGGCNNMKCRESDPPSNCPMEFCFACLKPKFQPYPGLENLGFCQRDHPTHNSH